MRYVCVCEGLISLWTLFIEKVWECSEEVGEEYEKQIFSFP